MSTPAPRVVAVTLTGAQVVWLMTLLMNASRLHLDARGQRLTAGAYRALVEATEQTTEAR